MQDSKRMRSPTLSLEAPVLVTGVAGFIGSHLVERLLAAGARVIGVDNVGPYGGAALKRDRLARLQGRAGFTFHESDLADPLKAAELFRACPGSPIVHLAAQPGVRYSLEAPGEYVQNNLVAFGHVLEGARHSRSPHLVFASSSSVYGGNLQLPYSTDDGVDHPLSLYAATKKANELMAHSYAHLFALPCTGLRFFTVYGPWGRTDMAPCLFTRAILENKPIPLFGHGLLRRDFTYVEDIVEGVFQTLLRPPTPDVDWAKRPPSPARSFAPYRVYNIGNSQPVVVLRFVELLEQALGRTATKDLLPPQPGDVEATAADVSDLEQDVGFRPSTPLEVGLPKFVAWYRAYFKV
jgi:UDP-glucuronate 4-epimerase